MDSPYVYPNLDLYNLSDLRPLEFSSQADRDQYSLIVRNRLPPTKVQASTPTVLETTDTSRIDQPMDTSAPMEELEAHPSSLPPSNVIDPNPLHDVLVTMTPEDIGLIPTCPSTESAPPPTTTAEPTTEHPDTLPIDPIKVPAKWSYCHVDLAVDLTGYPSLPTKEVVDPLLKSPVTRSQTKKSTRPSQLYEAQ